MGEYHDSTGASSPFEEGAEKQLGSWVFPHQILKILFTLAFSGFYQIFLWFIGPFLNSISRHYFFFFFLVMHTNS